MNYDLENRIRLVYLSEPLIITHEPWGAAQDDPPPPSQWACLRQISGFHRVLHQ